ncbi:MAG: GntR family transcriptional regulator [Xanthobacteraceae bacterium]|jgi:GntR family transcriptional regulator|nr:GntR family transcriptional regulator [Xanthobacteraceae bacterium]
MSSSASVNLKALSSLRPDSYVPLYMQLAEQFVEIIRNSHSRLVGAALPSEAECMEYFKVSRPTVRQAMAHLLIQGLITRGRGRGTFVAPQRLDHDLSRAFEDEMRSTDRSVRFELLERATVKAPLRVREALQLPADQTVEKIKRLRLLEGEVFGYEERYISSAYSRQVTQQALKQKAIYSLIKDYAGEFPARFGLTIRSIAATAEYARILGVKRGSHLLSSEHTYFLASDTPVLYGAVLFHGDKYQFSVQTPISPP